MEAAKYKCRSWNVIFSREYVELMFVSFVSIVKILIMKDKYKIFIWIIIIVRVHKQYNWNWEIKYLITIIKIIWTNINWYSIDIIQLVWLY